MFKKITLTVLLITSSLMLFSQDAEKSISEFEKKIPQLKFQDSQILKNSNTHFKMPGTVKYRLDSGLYEDKTTGNWLMFAKMEYAYDSDENLTERDFYMNNDETNLWELIYSNTYSYNENGEIVEMLYDEFDFCENIWTSYKYEFTYDSEGNLTQEFEYEWDENDQLWYETLKIDYTYENNNLMEQLEYEWDDIDQDWYLYWKIEYIYDAENNLIEEIEYEDDGGTWYYSDKTEYFYDENNYPSEEIYYFRELEEWLPDSKIEYDFEANGNLAMTLDYLYDDELSEFVPDIKMEFNYDNNYSFEDLIVPHIDEFAYNHMLTDHLMTAWDADTEEWVEISRGNIYYSEVEYTNMQELASENVRLYPNPANNIIRVNTSPDVNSSIKIYDLFGKLLYSKDNIGNNKAINLPDLQQGIYIYEIMSNEEVVSNGKLIIE